MTVEPNVFRLGIDGPYDASPREFPCRFKERSHQHYAEGWCYGLGISCGRPYALLLYDGDKVGVRYLDEHYHIELCR